MCTLNLSQYSRYFYNYTDTQVCDKNKIKPHNETYNNCTTECFNYVNFNIDHDIELNDDYLDSENENENSDIDFFTSKENDAFNNTDCTDPEVRDKNNLMHQNYTYNNFTIKSCDDIMLSLIMIFN